MNDSATDYQKLLSDTLQKQMIILGPAITLTKARHVPGITVTDDGRVTAIEGNPQEVSIKLLEQFRELSPLMVKKTMKPLLSAIISSYPTSAPKPTDKPEDDVQEEQAAQGHPTDEQNPQETATPQAVEAKLDAHHEDEQKQDALEHEQPEEKQDEKPEAAPAQPVPTQSGPAA